jgi:hypothetical protein
VTLGGYDESRFVPHNEEFSLYTNDYLPRPLVRGIEVSVANASDRPSHWGSNTQILSNMNTSFLALIDSSTPFLWLPDDVCDSFAKALNLTYNSTFDLYTLTTDQYNKYRYGSSVSFTFSVSSWDKTDDFGQPLQVPGVVNITISSAAFANTLRYPFMNEAIKYADPAVPYFPLRRAGNRTQSLIIGRAFMQEAYLITTYEAGTYTLHQAKFPEKPSQRSIKTIPRPGVSKFPGPPPQNSSGLTTSQMAGIGSGIVLLCIILLVSWCCYRKKRRRRNGNAPEEDNKDSASSFVPDTPKTPVSRIFSKIIRRKKSKKSESTESTESSKDLQPVEVAADSNHELYELAAPLSPVELDADNDVHSINGDTELGSEATQNMTAYELARRKLDRQLQGPVPAYTPAAHPMEASSSGEKSIQDVSPIATYRPSDFGSRASSPSHGNSNTFPSAIPSPMTPHGDWHNRLADLPTPMTVAPPFPSPLYTGSSSYLSNLPPLPASPQSLTYDPSSVSRSNSSNATSPVSPIGTLLTPPSPVFQRTPIDPSRVICLGPLPENVQLPRQQSLPHLVGPDGRRMALPGLHPDAHQSTETLGSNYTEVEERMVQELTRQASITQPPQSHEPNLSSQHELENQRSQERIDPGSELVHVPQLAERRYSWEEER